MTGLEVGVYEFTLTVTDERKLQSSDTVTVVVREGQFLGDASRSPPLRSVASHR